MKKKIIKSKFNPKVHYTIHNRKVFKGKMFLLTFALILILLGCAAMFTFGTVTWDPDKGFEPAAAVKYPWQAGLVATGAIVAVAAIVCYIFICKHIFKGFYDTQVEYQKSADFKKKKAKASKVELFKLKKKDLKWYKKIGYITTDQMRQAFEEQTIWKRNCKEKKEKINYAEPMA